MPVDNGGNRNVAEKTMVNFKPGVSEPRSRGSDTISIGSGRRGGEEERIGSARGAFPMSAAKAIQIYGR